MTAKSDPWLKRLAALGWRGLVNLQTLLAAADIQGGPRLWYGGARAGDAGGPALKLRKLQSVFPQHRRGFNLVYLLSAAPYLSACAMKGLKRKGVPLVLNQNGVFYPAWFAGDWRARNRSMAAAHERADHVFYQSDFCRRAALRFLGERQGRFEILYNAVDTQAFRPPAQPPAPPFTFLITGRIDAHQGYRLTQAVEALALARKLGLECRLLAAGVIAPEISAQALALAEKCGIAPALTIEGRYSQEQAPGLYRRAHAYLTLTHQDACPSAVIEAMASGLPVVHPTSGGVPELVAEAGIGIPTGEDWDKPLIPEAPSIAQAMIGAAEAGAALSLAARQRAVGQFDIENWLARHQRLFHDLLARHD